MPTYSKTEPNCGSPEQIVFVGNVRLDEFSDPDATLEDPASAVLTIDVLASPGNELRQFYFVTLTLQIVAPSDARFANHSGRNNFHWDVPADTARTSHAFDPPNPDVMYWAEDVDAVSPTSTLRIREGMTDLLSGPGNGRTYFVGITGVTATEEVVLRTFASACDLPMTSCELVIAELHAGEAIPGPLA